MFPEAVNKSHSCLHGHTTAPQHPSPVPRIEKKPFQAWKGPRLSSLFAVLVPPLDPRLIPAREGLPGDNMFSLYSESYLLINFGFVPNLFLG